MAITYALRENHLTSDPNDYMAIVESSRTVDIDNIIDRMIERGSTTTKADILAVMEDFCGALHSLVEEGANINLPFANYSLSIKGVFNGTTDLFDPARHHIAVNLNPGRDLKQFLKSGLKVEKKETTAILPAPLEFTDFMSGEKNSIVTPGGMAQVLGNRLKVNVEDAEEGIWFVKEDATEVKVAVIGQNKPASLMFMIPAELTTGDYTLEVRTKTGDAVRRGRLLSTLSVA